MSAADDRLQRELRTLCEQWRERARRFMNDANMLRGESREIIRLTAMASTLDWSASDLELALRIEDERRGREVLQIEGHQGSEGSPHG